MPACDAGGVPFLLYKRVKSKNEGVEKSEDGKRLTETQTRIIEMKVARMNCLLSSICLCLNACLCSGVHIGADFCLRNCSLPIFVPEVAP